jgi:diguanylate cyclase (GGDEF)-like protein
MATPEQGRRKFQEELTRLQRHRIAFSVVMLTIGNLAEINTRMGHVIGQTMLKNVAVQIKQHLDITDFCSRYSLDRILVVLQNAIGVIMGSNIGTTITVLLGAIGGVQAKQRVG